MLSVEEQKRYSKQIILPEIGNSGQEKLKAARVLVVGAGGLGCPVLQYLVAAGVGTIGIVDGDNIGLSNLQRQVLYTENDIGQKKAIVAGHKLRALNRNVELVSYPYYIDSGNVLEMLGGYDIIVDGSDNFGTRYLLSDACVICNKPMVSGAIYKFEGQVSVFNYRNGPTYRCLFPDPPNPGESPNCADIGVIATLPGIIGTIQANEVIKIITGAGTPLSGKLLVIDTLDMTTRMFAFSVDPKNKTIRELTDLPQYCMANVNNISYEELQGMLRDDPLLQLVDVREPEEHLRGNIGGVNIPLSQFNSALSVLVPENQVVLYCASGVRSNQFALRLIQNGYSKIFQVQNGISYLLID